MQIKIVSKTGRIPEYKTEGSAGVDLQAYISDTPLFILPGERKLINTGIKLAIPKGYEGQIRSRSGLALKHGIKVLNSPGTIDSDYTGEIGVILQNTSKAPFEVVDGDRIAQLVFSKVESVTFEEVNSLEATSRGEGGFGSTGK